ncbi:MAG TPA: hypothetical protein VJ508_08235, partial [Saprospiraceae bacterium]|nr:hypothetical protein [Saprospiraceae bacterium]
MRNLKAISPLPWQPEKNPKWLEKMNESQVEGPVMSILNLAALEATPLQHDPFEYLVVPDFIQPEALER